MKGKVPYTLSNGCVVAIKNWNLSISRIKPCISQISVSIEHRRSVSGCERDVSRTKRGWMVQSETTGESSERISGDDSRNSKKDFRKYGSS